MAHFSDPSQIEVLVVEDEPLIMMDTVDFLEEAGFRVHQAGNASEAIRLLERHADIRVLFTDVHMPGSMDGLALASLVRDRWPPVQIIVTSGVAKVTADQMPVGGLFFPKPYKPAAVVDAMRDLTT